MGGLPGRRHLLSEPEEWKDSSRQKQEHILGGGPRSKDTKTNGATTWTGQGRAFVRGELGKGQLATSFGSPPPPPPAPAAAPQQTLK